MYIGLDIGGTKCAVTLADLGGTILKKIRFDTAATAAEISSAARPPSPYIRHTAAGSKSSTDSNCSRRPTI